MIVENTERVGNFTSSQVYRLMANGKAKGSVGAPFYTYVNEKRRERKAKRSFDLDKYSKATAWGNLLELYVFKHKLDIGYVHLGDQTKVHPNYKYWSGSADVIKPEIKVSDIKCFEPKAFTEYAEALELQSIEVLKKDFAQKYWQLASNAAILGLPRAEVILFTPYESELEDVREFAANYDGDDQWRYRFIFECEKYELPYLPNDSEYKDLYKFEFEVPKQDIEDLTFRIMAAESELRNPTQKK